MMIKTQSRNLIHNYLNIAVLSLRDQLVPPIPHPFLTQLRVSLTNVLINFIVNKKRLLIVLMMVMLIVVLNVIPRWERELDLDFLHRGKCVEVSSTYSPLLSLMVFYVMSAD
jgi:hypothetical protein